MKKITLQLVLLFTTLLLVGCSGESEEESNTVGVVWNRYGSQYGYETDIAIGNIKGEPENRVYMCEKPGSPSAGLYKGFIDGNIITWDNQYNLPQTEIVISGDTMEFYYLLSNRTFAGSYEKGEWTNECDLIFESGELVDNKKTVNAISNFSGDITIQSIKLGNLNIPHTARTTTKPSCDRSVNSPAGDSNGNVLSYVTYTTEGVSGTYTATATCNFPLDQLKRGCNTIQIVGGSGACPFDLYVMP